MIKTTFRGVTLEASERMIAQGDMLISFDVGTQWFPEDFTVQDEVVYVIAAKVTAEYLCEPFDRKTMKLMAARVYQHLRDLSLKQT